MVKTNFRPDLFIAQVLGSGVDNALRILNKGFIRRLARSMKKAADAEFERFFPFVVQEFIGQPSGKHGDRISLQINDPKWAEGERSAKAYLRRRPGGRAKNKWTWPNLSNRWMNEKGNDRFFENTGRLKDFLSKQSAVKRFGETRITIKRDVYRNFRRSPQSASARSAKVLLVMFDVKMAPKISPRMLPFLEQGDVSTNNPTSGLEFRMFGPHYGQKLRGPKGAPGRHRPLIQPVLNYYLRYKLPHAMARAIEKNVNLSGNRVVKKKRSRRR